MREREKKRQTQELIERKAGGRIFQVIKRKSKGGKETERKIGRKREWLKTGKEIGDEGGGILLFRDHSWIR